MIKELCAKLADKRKELGLSIEEVVDRTKLHPLAIRDIEAGDLNNISEIYLKGFIRIYASFLGIEVSHEFIDEVSHTKSVPKKDILVKSVIDRKSTFETMLAQSAAGDSVPKAGLPIVELPFQESDKDKKTHPPVKRNLSRRRRKTIVFLAAAVCLIILINLARFTITKINQFFSRPPAVSVSADKALPAAPEVIVSSPPAPPVTPPLPDEIAVSLRVKRDCFLRVAVDGKLLFEGILNKGTVEMWKGTKEIEFKISDGSAVYLEVNGKPLPPLTTIRKPIKKLKITASDIYVDK